MNDVSDQTVVQLAAAVAGFNTETIDRLPEHASILFLLGSEQVVARVTRGVDAEAAAARSVRVTRWFAAHGVPVATPADVDQPQVIHERVITFWTYYPQYEKPRPPARELGRLLRLLHEAPPPPVELPSYTPLGGLPNLLESTTALDQRDVSWLTGEHDRLLCEYHQLDSVLGVGHVHGDAYPGNTLWRGQDALLGDWDEVAIGPRELDLVNTYQGARFGRSQDEIADFAAAYGHDISRWSGLATLRQVRELHTLGSYIRKADRGDVLALRELAHRVATLRSGDQHTLWTPR